MSKKRNKHLIASEAHEKKYKERKDIIQDYVTWTSVHRSGRLGREFNTGCLWNVIKIVGIFLFCIFLAIIGKSCT